MDSNGNTKICDFGLCKKVPLNQIEEMRRSKNSFAPEELNDSTHFYNYSVDYWYYGICIYRMLTSVNPFIKNNKESILNDEMPDLEKNKKNDNYISDVTKDFVSRLLIKDPKERLASERIKKEIFFMDINWENLEAGNERTPINPKVLFEFIN